MTRVCVASCVQVVSGEFKAMQELPVEGEVTCMHMQGDWLVVGYAAVQAGVTKVPVGQLTSWNFTVNKKFPFSVRQP